MVKMIKQRGRVVLLTVCILFSTFVVSVEQPCSSTFGTLPTYACAIQYPDCGG